MGGGATASEFFSLRIQINKKLGGGGWMGWGLRGGVDGWPDEQVQTNLPLQLLRSWGHTNASMYQLCP